MNILASLPLALGLMAASVPAAASDPATTGRLPVPANRLVGLWTTDIYVSFEACTPGAPEPPLIGHNTLMFNAGGTMFDMPQSSPPGAPGDAQIRSHGLGTWSYNPRTGRYSVFVRFDWFSASNGAYLGYNEIDRTIQLSSNRNTAYGAVVATRYTPDGTPLGQLCGHAVSHRL